MSPNLLLLSWEFETRFEVSLLAYMDSKKLDTILREPRNYYGSAAAISGIKFLKFSWGCMPLDPPSLAWADTANTAHRQTVHTANTATTADTANTANTADIANSRQGKQSRHGKHGNNTHGKHRHRNHGRHGKQHTFCIALHQICWVLK